MPTWKTPDLPHWDLGCLSVKNPLCFLEIAQFEVVIQTGKLQPVFIWREKPVLLSLLSNLRIPVPASYPIFRTKWREIS